VPRLPCDRLMVLDTSRLRAAAETCKLSGAESTPWAYIDVLDGHVCADCSYRLAALFANEGRYHGPTCLRCTEPKPGRKRTCHEAVGNDRTQNRVRHRNALPRNSTEVCAYTSLILRASIWPRIG
jgi:hypothetical protein